MKNYKVHLYSKPGFYTYYEGYIEVNADNDDEAVNRAFMKLKKTFPDRTRDMWVIEKIEVKYGS